MGVGVGVGSGGGVTVTVTVLEVAELVVSSPGQIAWNVHVPT